jgi:hypothetical protein
MEIEAVDLSQEEKSFTKYLTNWMPILDKLSPKEMVDLFANAKKLIDLEKELLKIEDVKTLATKIKELQDKYEYPPNKEIGSLAKSTDEKDALKKIQYQIKSDIGLDVSPSYINKVLYNIESFKDNKKQLMKYITNIVLKGSGHGVVTELETEIEKLSSKTYLFPVLELKQRFIQKLRDGKIAFAPLPESSREPYKIQVKREVDKADKIYEELTGNKMSNIPYQVHYAGSVKDEKMIEEICKDS